MSRRIVSGIMLTLLLTSIVMITLNISILPVSTPNKENPKPYSVYEDKWNFNKTDEWAEFAEVDNDSAELIIGVNDAKPNSHDEIFSIISENGGNLVNTISMGGKVCAVVADIPSAVASSFAMEMQNADLSRYIEPNMKFQASFVPNDTYWSQQWGPKKIEADYAWDVTVGNPSVLVAVIDTGIDWDHPDLAANYVPLGYDWVNDDVDPMDDHGHGTHCAGIIAAVINNSIGIAGLAQVQIMAEKGLDSWGSGYEDDLANAIIHAVDQEADILSNSWGGYGDSTLIHEAVKYAYEHGVLVVAAAGNSASNNKLYPAAYDEVVAVTATDEYDKPASFTSFGDWVELAAPGVDIYSTVWDNSYTYMSGTSMACPHVSGVAALIWSVFPSVTSDWVRLRLQYTADDLGDPGFDDYYGYGRVNARKAIEQPDHDLIVWDWERPPYVEPGTLATVNTTVFNFGSNNETNITVQLLVNDSVIDSALISFLASCESKTVSCSWNPTVKGLYNVTSCVMAVANETITENNFVWAYVYVGFPLKAIVLDSAGTDLSSVINTWETLNNEWCKFGSRAIYIDYTTLNIDEITYDDIVATGADVLIISCAYAWEFTDSEVDAITRYIQDGHGLIATARTFSSTVPNNKKLAPLFGLNETITCGTTSTDLLHILNTTHPLFVDIPTPFIFNEVDTAVPSDGRWDENELVRGTYLALGHYKESAITTYRGLVYIAPWLEIIPSYYHFHLQLLYNAITWSNYQKPEHELVASLESPPTLKPGTSTMLNATVHNRGLNNETDVELSLLINGMVVKNVTIPELVNGTSYTISYLWTPTVEAMYNVTSYVVPVPNETITENNVASIYVSVGFCEDFTTYVEVDPNTHVSKTAHHIDFNFYLNEEAYVYKDFGVGHFDDFTHLIQGQANTKSGLNTYADIWALTNSVDDLQGIDNANGDYISFFLYRSDSGGGTLSIYIQECDGGTVYNDYYYPASWSTPYYITIQKSGTTFTAKIYSDASRTVLVDTLSLTLHHDYTFRYLFAGVTRNLALARTLDVDIENLYLHASQEESAHDVAVANVSTDKTVVSQGYCTKINMVVENQGNYTETFNVTAYANTTSIASQTITLTSGNSTTLTFIWNTTGFDKGKYIINAVADTVPGEIDIEDNIYNDGTVTVAMVGDIVPDGIIDIFDIAYVAVHFGHKPPDNHLPNTPEYTACFNADLNSDGLVDIFDIAAAAINFGLKLPMY